MRYIQGDIRLSLWRDIMDRMNEKEELGLLRRTDYRINDNAMSIVHLPTGNTIQSRGFKKSSGAQTAKMKSIAGATHIFVEETEEVEEDDFDQLDDSLRTVKSNPRIFRIFNPPKKNHWLIKKNYTLTESRVKGYYIARPIVRANFLSIFATYHDNIKYVDAGTIDKFEGYRVTKPDWYWTVVRGLVSEGAKGRIYNGWTAITNAEFNALPYPSYYTLDFGFSNDPLALSEVKRHNKKRYARELIYETGVSDEELVRKLKALRVGSRPIVADSADPKSISFLRGKGFNVVAARKGADSIRFGIKSVQGLDWYYTDDSKNLAYEYQEYRWQLDVNKELTGEPVPKHDHCFPAGTMIATITGLVPIEKVQNGNFVLTRDGFKRVLSAGITGFDKEVFVYEVQGHKIRCTSDHPIYTENRGFICAEDLTNCDTLTILDIEKYNKLCQSKLSNMADSPTADTPNPTAVRIKITSPEREKSTESTPASSFIDGFGQTTTARFLTGIISIIKTAIRAITTRQTLTAYPHQNTFRPTIKIAGFIPQRAGNILTKYALLQQNGTKAPKVGSGIANTQNVLLNLFNPLINSAFSAGKPTRQKLNGNRSNSAPITANQQADGPTMPNVIWSNESAWSASKISQSTDTQKPSLVPLNVSGIYYGNHVVYNLTVEDKAEFFADGILVHNCLDGLRYGELTDPWGGGAIEHT